MIVTVVIAVINIWAAITIKFAPDKATVVRQIKSMLWRVVRWIGNAWSVGLIIFLFASSLPVDRFFIFGVVLNSFSLFNNYLLTLFINPLIENDRAFNEQIRKLVSVLRS